MYIFLGFLLLPSKLLILLLIAAIPSAAELQWPYNLPAHIKYYPEDEVHVRKHLHIQHRLAWQKPIGVRKMSLDEGEKFFLDYWQFEDPLQTVGNGSQKEVDIGPNPGISDPQIESTPDFMKKNAGHNNTVGPNLLSLPLLLHAEPRRQTPYLRFAIRDVLHKRDFRCPENTSSCASINRPDSCCPSSQTCVRVPDTGLGDVGCCAQGQSCGGSISTCDTNSGFSSCPGSPNGGCCIPDYRCEGIGCVFVNTRVISQAPPSTSQSSSSAPSLPPSPSSSSLPPSSSLSPPPSSTIPLTCSSGFQSCPASLGGGCCPSDASCGAVFCSTSSTSPPSTASAGVPVRPTSDTPPPVTSAPVSAPLPSDQACPTGYYMCSAYYRGGCCRVGRDCDSVSCPEPATATIVNANGITVMGPSGSYAAAASAASPTCATGWSSCAQSLGGNCCPTGFVCGGSCTATGSLSGTLAKISPSGALHIEPRYLSIFLGTLTLIIGLNLF